MRPRAEDSVPSLLQNKAPESGEGGAERRVTRSLRLGRLTDPQEGFHA